MRTAKWQLTLGLVAMVGFAGAGQSAVAGSPATNLSFTIHVRNDAGVDSKILKEAEDGASRIFHEAGVTCQWVETPATSRELNEVRTAQPAVGLSHIRVNLLPRATSLGMEMPAGVTGLAPGAGPDRLLVQVFYDRVDALARREAQRQAATEAEGNAARAATASQILGEAFAHEIGHILLNLSEHTRTGIMRGPWNLNDLRDIAGGYLGFTKQQGQVIQAEVARRVQQDTLEAASRFETLVYVAQ